MYGTISTMDGVKFQCYTDNGMTASIAKQFGFKRSKSGIYETQNKSVVKRVESFCNDIALKYIKDWKPESNVCNEQIEICYPTDPSLEYMPHQVTGIQFALNKRRALIGDAPGVGKSIEAAGYILSLLNAGYSRFIVTCPLSMIKTLAREFKKWAGVNAVTVDKKTEFNKPGVYIMTFDRMRIAHKKIMQFQPEVFIVDEAHFLKNPDAKRTKVAKEIKESCKRVLFMTGTPCPNSIQESFFLLNLLDEERFCSHYFHERNFADYHHEVMIRRTLDDVFDMPPKIRQFIFLDDESTRKKVKSELEHCYNDLGDLMISFKDFSRVRREAAELKLEIIKPLLFESFIEAANEESKLIIFAYHINVINSIKEMFEGAGIETVAYHSEMSQNERESADVRFQFGDASVMASSIRSGGVGRTLTAARFGVMAELDYIPANVEQAEGRIYRHGTTKPVLIKYPIVENSFDELMLDILFKKQYDVNRIIKQTNL